MTVDYLGAHHIWPVEAHGFNIPTVWPLPRHHTYNALISPGAGWARRRTCHVITQLVVVICLCLDLCLRQEHNVTPPPALHCPNGLRQSKAPAIPDVECRDRDPEWAWGIEERRWRCCVQAVDAMEDRPGKGEWHPSWSSQKRTKKRENPCIGYFRSYSSYFFCIPLNEHRKKPILRSCRLWRYSPFGVGAPPPSLFPAAVSPVE